MPFLVPNTWASAVGTTGVGCTSHDRGHLLQAEVKQLHCFRCLTGYNRPILVRVRFRAVAGRWHWYRNTAAFTCRSKSVAQPIIIVCNRKEVRVG